VSPFAIRTIERDGAMLVRIDGELDTFTAGAFRRALEACAERDVVVDLTAVGFLAAEAIGILIGNARRAKQHHFAVAAGPQSWARRVMLLCSYPYPVSDSLDDALRSLGLAARAVPRPAHGEHANRAMRGPGERQNPLR
jgi:anti-anti-sigma factor